MITAALYIREEDEINTSILREKRCIIDDDK
jgi:hypothetical protein